MKSKKNEFKTVRGQMRVDNVLFSLPPSKCHPQVKSPHDSKKGDNFDL